jgi:hypothetical protein
MSQHVELLTPHAQVDRRHLLDLATCCLDAPVHLPGGGGARGGGPSPGLPPSRVPSPLDIRRSPGGAGGGGVGSRHATPPAEPPGAAAPAPVAAGGGAGRGHHARQTGTGFAQSGGRAQPGGARHSAPLPAPLALPHSDVRPKDFAPGETRRGNVCRRGHACTILAVQPRNPGTLDPRAVGAWGLEGALTLPRTREQG